MNPRAFCREGDFEIALLLTYSFDALFFERVVLKDLWAGGTTECLVVADRRELDEAIPRALGQVQHLGTRYRLVASSGSGRQHAKLVLRAGQSGALVWIGSGNLTGGGWGNNRELATCWRVKPTDGSAVAEFLSLVKAVSAILHGAAANIGQKILSLPWVSNADLHARSEYSLLLSHPNQPLSVQLAARWKNREFHTVRVLTGSTDRKGACLRWIAQTFSTKNAIIGLSPESCDFSSRKLKELPLDVRIVPLAATPRPHAKFYFFEGNNDFACVVGSANCSAAAWLVPGEAGGNTELIAVFDHCKRDDYSPVLSVLDSTPDVSPESVLVEPNVDPEEPVIIDPHGTIKILTFSASSISGELLLEIQTDHGQVLQAEAKFDDFVSTLRNQDGQGKVFVGGYPDLPPTKGTHFAQLVLKLDDGQTIKILRWLDEEEKLTQSSLRNRIISIERLGRFSRPSEQKKILEDIAAVARLLFIKDEFPDPTSNASDSSDDQSSVSSPVDPLELVRSLDDIPEQRMSQRRVGSRPGLAFHGIMRALFNVSSHSDNYIVDDEVFTTFTNEEEFPSGEIVVEKKRFPKEQPPDSVKKRLFKVMDEFIAETTQSDFVLNCSATQFSQAIAFPLAVSARGLEGQWIDSETALSWSREVLDFLFCTKLVDQNEDTYRGALEVLESRYRDQGRLSTLHRVLGDGLLWMALITDLAQREWNDVGWELAKVLYMSDLFDSSVLYQYLDTEGLSELLNGYAASTASRNFLESGATTASLVNKLEKLLSEGHDEFIAGQNGQQHKIGDLVFSPKAGFGWVEEASPITRQAKVSIYLRRHGEIRQFRSNWYCNVRLAAVNSPPIAKLIELLRKS